MLLNSIIYVWNVWNGQGIFVGGEFRRGKKATTKSQIVPKSSGLVNAIELNKNVLFFSF